MPEQVHDDRGGAKGRGEGPPRRVHARRSYRPRLRHVTPRTQEEPIGSPALGEGTGVIGWLRLLFSFLEELTMPAARADRSPHSGALMVSSASPLDHLVVNGRRRGSVFPPAPPHIPRFGRVHSPVPAGCVHTTPQYGRTHRLEETCVASARRRGGGSLPIGRV